MASRHNWATWCLRNVMNIIKATEEHFLNQNNSYATTQLTYHAMYISDHEHTVSHFIQVYLCNLMSTYIILYTTSMSYHLRIYPLSASQKVPLCAKYIQSNRATTLATVLLDKDRCSCHCTSCNKGLSLRYMDPERPRHRYILTSMLSLMFNRTWFLEAPYVRSKSTCAISCRHKTYCQATDQSRRW